MGFSSSIQFREPETVIDAFINRGCEAWSIVVGKQFLFKGIGVESFKAHIEQLAESDGNATYTAQVYDDITDMKQIKSNTPADGSFNFKFNEDLRQSFQAVRGFPITGRVNNNNADILAKLDEITKRLDEVEQPKSDESLGMIGKIMEHPTLGPIIAGIAPTIVQMIVGAITGTKPDTVQPALPQPSFNQPRSNAVLNGIDDDKIINEAVAKLKLYDANLAVHLQKLVQIAENDPATFTMIIKSFD